MLIFREEIIMRDLQEFAIIYVALNEDLSKQDKDVFVKFIIESTDKQIETLLVTGKMYKKDQLNEADVSGYGYQGIGGQQAYDIGATVNPARFSDIFNPNGHIIANQLIGTGMVLAGTVLAALAIQGSIKAYKTYLSKAGRACAGLQGEHRSDCIVKYKHEARKNQLAALQHNITLCVKSKHPDKCRQKIQKKISSVQATLNARPEKRINK
jgi:hypothetical protein